MRVAEKAHRMGLPPGAYELDGFNQTVLTGGISFTITARVSANCDHWLLEINEQQET